MENRLLKSAKITPSYRLSFTVYLIGPGLHGAFTLFSSLSDADCRPGVSTQGEWGWDLIYTLVHGCDSSFVSAIPTQSLFPPSKHKNGQETQKKYTNTANVSF